MAVSLAWAVAWLSGVFWQTGEGGVPPSWICAVVACLSSALALGCWLAQRRPAVARRVGESDKRWVWRCIGALAVCSLAWASTGWRASVRLQEALPDAWAGRDVQAVVQVEGLPQPVPGGVLLDVRVLKWLPTDATENGPGAVSRSGPWPLRLSLHMPLADGLVPMAGEQWRVTVQLHAPDGLSNPGGYDNTLAYFERGVRAVGSVRQKGPGPVRVSEQAERPWQGLIDRWRQRVRSAIFQHVPEARAAGILAGLSVGDQSAIEREDWDLFRQTGIAHLVSISGAHIAMFGWMAALLVRRIWSRWPRGVHRWPAPDVAMWVAVGASGLYALASGWGVPAQRTVYMMALVCCLRTSGRRWPWPLVWLSSAVGLTALDPWAIRQVGFWLSYVAVGVLLSRGMNETRVIRPPMAEGAPGWPARLTSLMASAWSTCVDIMRIQCLITLALMPLSLVVFQQASISSLLANLIAIPVFTLGITPLSLLGAVWSPCWDLGAWLIQCLMGPLAELARAWPAMAAAPVLPWWVALGGVLAGAALALPMQWRWRLGLLPFGLPLVCLPQGWHVLPAPRPGTFALVAADVGQGTAVLVRTAHHELLFDTGPRIGAQLNAGDRTLLPLFRAMGVNRLHVMMISHQDTDHVGGAAAIIGQMPVEQMRSSLDESHALRHMAGVHGEPVPHVACLAGQQWQWDGVQFEVLHPSPQAYAHRDALSPNAMSCVLKVIASGPERRSALLTGDIESEQEAELVAREADRLRSTVLIAGHHGSQTSSTAAFLRAVVPQQVVIQVGRRNRYGHPSPSVLARYGAMALNWVATPACGAYVWYSDGSPAAEADVSSAAASGASPRWGRCWRPEHHHYWDMPSPMAAQRSE